MTTFTERFKWHTKGFNAISTGLCPCCDTCAEAYGVTLEELTEGIENGTLFDEGGFSHFVGGCDTCGSTLGGTTYAVHMLDDKTDEIIHCESCIDCVQYIANGEVPEGEGN